MSIPILHRTSSVERCIYRPKQMSVFIMDALSQGYSLEFNGEAKSPNNKAPRAMTVRKQVLPPSHSGVQLTL